MLYLKYFGLLIGLISGVYTGVAYLEGSDLQLYHEHREQGIIIRLFNNGTLSNL